MPPASTHQFVKNKRDYLSVCGANMIPSLLLLGAVTSGALAFPTHNDYNLHERRDALPAHWIEGRRLDPKVSLPMRIGLTQRNLDHGHDLLSEMSGLLPISLQCVC